MTTRFLKNGDVTEDLTFSGGLELNKAPSVIPDIKHVRSQNMFPTISGILQKRPGLTLAQYIDTQSEGIHSVNRLFIPHPSSGYKYVLQDLYSVSLSDDPQLRVVASNLDNVTLYLENHQLITDKPGPSTNTDPFSFCNFRRYTVCCTYPNDGDTTRDQTAPNSVIVLHPTIDSDGITELFNAPFVFDVMSFGTQAIPMNPRVCCSYRGRMRYFNFGLGMENWMVSADRVSSISPIPPYQAVTAVPADSLSQDGYHVEFEQIAGERITAAFEAQLQATGSPVETCLVVLTDKSMLICTGDVAESSTLITPPETLFLDFVANKVNYDVGCVSEATIAKTPYGYVWASASDVWLLNGNAPVKIGTSITQALQDTPPESRKWWTAAYCKNPGVYVLDLVTARGTDDRYLQKQQYWLQLNDAEMPRNANAAKWFGPMIVLLDDGSANGDAFGGHHGGIVTDYDGERIVKVVCQHGYLGGQDTNGTCLIDITTGGENDDYPFQYVASALDWEANADYTIGDVVKGTKYEFDGMFYVCAVTGTSAGTEPIWANGVVDGTVTWDKVTSNLHGVGLRFYPLNFNNASLQLNLIDFKSKEFALGTTAVDKVTKKIDLTAHASLPQELTVSAISNQGAKNQTLGTPLFGQGNSFHAGTGILDTTLITDQELEAKTARPSPSTGVIRSKFLQVEIQDSGQIVIDETCNKLVFGTRDCVPYTATIELTSGGGKYRAFQSIDDLTGVLITAMNLAMPAGTYASGYSTLINWSRTEIAGAAGDPLLVSLTANDDGANETTYCLFYGDSNDVTMVGVTGTDLAISKKLMALLGFDTDTSVANDIITIFGTTPTSAPVFVQIASLPNSFSPFAQRTEHNIWARSQISNRRSAKIALATGQILARLTNTSALQYSNR